MRSENITMARSLLTVIFLFLFAVSVYAGKPVAPVVQTLSARNITTNSAELVCSVNAGSQAAWLSFVRKFPLPELGLGNFSVPASLRFIEYSWVWQNLQPNTLYQYNCYASNSVGTSPEGSVISFTTLPVVSDPPVCTLTANPSTITSGSSSVISYNSVLADTFVITWPNNSMSVTPNVPSSFVDSPAVTTIYTGTVTNAAGQRNCNVTVTIGNVPPQSVTVGATLLPSYNGFEFQCSNMYGTTPTRLFMRLTSGGVTKDYNYTYVPAPGTFTEFWSAKFTSYDMYTGSVKPSPFIPLILDLNTLYSYQCCSENSFGSSCGEISSIYTAPYTLSFNYDYAPEWPRSVSYGARSLWALTINNVNDPLNCVSSVSLGIYYLASDNTIQLAGLRNLFFAPGWDNIPHYNCNSATGTDVGVADSFRWDCFPKDGVLDEIDSISGEPICVVLYKDGYEHFFSCSTGGVLGKPLYAVASVGGFAGINNMTQVCPMVPFPFGNARAGVNAKSNAVIIRHSSVGARGRGQGKLGMGGYEKIE